MSELFNVRRPNGKLAAQHHTRELAEREIEWHRASFECALGEYTIERIEREPDCSRWGYGYPNRFAGKWPSAKLNELKQRYAAREQVDSLGRYFGTNTMVICRMARRLGFVKRIDDPSTFEKHRGRWTRREEELANFMYDEGIGVHEIPKHIERTSSAVCERLRSTAGEMSTRSRNGRFIKKGRGRAIHRVLETPSELDGAEQYGGS